MSEVHTPSVGGASPVILALRPRPAAIALGISERKLREITADPTSGIPHAKLGSCTVYPLRELTDWLSKQAEKGEH